MNTIWKCFKFSKITQFLSCVILFNSHNVRHFIHKFHVRWTHTATVYLFSEFNFKISCFVYAITHTCCAVNITCIPVKQTDDVEVATALWIAYSCHSPCSEMTDKRLRWVCSILSALQTLFTRHIMASSWTKRLANVNATAHLYFRFVRAPTTIQKVKEMWGKEAENEERK
jgi:hypothetical protein